nr:hypothetical protein GCM10025699_19070 [Microbacterium flavescens]
MTELRGVGIGLGVAQGPVARMAEPLPAPSDAPSTIAADEEKARVTEAVGAVARELEQRGAQAGGAAQDVLEAQAMMAEDPSLADEVASRIDQGKTAEFAVFDAFASFREQLTALGGYLGERAADLDDVAQRVIARLRGEPAPGVPDPGHPFVLVAKDLAPADTAMLDLDKVLALVTTEGGPTSHTAILAREKSIVAIVGAVDAKSLRDGETVIVDAAAGVVTTAPTSDELERAQRRAEDRASASSAPITDGALADGTPIPLLANLGKPEAALDAVALGAEGSGSSAPSSCSSARPRLPPWSSSARRTRSSSRRSRARRLSCGCSTPAPTSRSRSSTTLTRRTPRSASAASAPCARVRTSCASS